MQTAESYLVETRLRDTIATYQEDPIGFVLFVYPWGSGALGPTERDPEPGPDRWQAEVLMAIGRQCAMVRAGVKKDAVRIAVRSGHGPGKSALVSWIIHWFISCFPNGKGSITANTATQLETKTWSELRKWIGMAKNKHWFDARATSLSVVGVQANWRVDAIPWSKERPEAWAGTHAEYVLLIFDEASTIADIVWETAEGALTDYLPIFIVFGNPTRNTGRFRDCFGRFRNRWLGMKVDSRFAKRTNKDQIAQWKEDYGENSDFFKVRVTGDFPSQSSWQFIPQEDVDRARAKQLPPGNMAPAVLGVDVARGGGCMTVFSLRRGPELCWQKVFDLRDTMKIVEHVVTTMREEKPRLVVIDANGVGAGVYDMLIRLGYENVMAYLGSERSSNWKAYANKRAEAWGILKNWLKIGKITNDETLAMDLTSMEYAYNVHEQIQLERKEDLLARGIPSPDRGDSLALTFAFDVVPTERERPLHERGMTQEKPYDPLNHF